MLNSGNKTEVFCSLYDGMMREVFGLQIQLNFRKYFAPLMDGISIPGTHIVKRERWESQHLFSDEGFPNCWFVAGISIHKIINSYNNARGDHLVILSPYQGHSILVAVARLPKGEVIQSFYSYLILPFIHARFASGISASHETVFR